MKELSIPKIIHQIWIGPKEKPTDLLNSWEKKHSDNGWKYIFWDEKKIQEEFPNGLINQNQFNMINEFAGKADILRYEILYKYGGFYCDADSICLEKLDDFLLEDDFFICFENEKNGQGRNILYANGFIGCKKNSQTVLAFINHISENLNKENINSKLAWMLTGPLIVTDIINSFLKNQNYCEKIKIYPSYLFMDMKKILSNDYSNYNEEELKNRKYKKYAEHLWYSTKNQLNKSLYISNQKPKIGLSAIVKNESKVITNMLESASKFIDYWCIVDTGSTDGTQQIIKEYFEQKNIPGELIEIPWKNFSTSRNKALDGLKGKVDWGFWMDADETLTFKSDFNTDAFKYLLTNIYTGGFIDVLHGQLIYKRMQLFNLTYPWKWIGPVHEVLVNDDKYHKSLNINDFFVNYHTTGHSWTSQTQEQKYEKYIKLLTDYIEENPDQDNSRWIFYLAQSYRDTGSKKYYPDVIKWYQKRLEINTGYNEEKYISALYIARTKRLIGWNAGLGYSETDVLEAFMKCTQYNTERIEHFEPIIEHYQRLKDWENAYIFSSHTINKKLKDFLFSEPQIYQWKIYDIHAMNCFYTKRYDEMKKYGEILKQILQTTNFIHTSQVDRVKSNLKFYLPS